MITDERIAEITLEFDVHNISVKDFARALLAGVSLPDMLRQEEEFINQNRAEFQKQYARGGYCGVYFCERGLCMVTEFHQYNLNWSDYYAWKKSIQEGE